MRETMLEFQNLSISFNENKKVVKNLSLAFSLKAHAGQADFFEYGVAYHFNR